jgi:hypothetical protein
MKVFAINAEPALFIYYAAESAEEAERVAIENWSPLLEGDCPGPQERPNLERLAQRFETTTYLGGFEEDSYFGPYADELDDGNPA